MLKNFLIFFAKFKRRTQKHFPLIQKGVIVASCLLSFLLVYSLLPSAYSLLTTVSKVLLPQNRQLKSTYGQVNVLILGTGGPKHDGPNLTDTMLIASLPSSGSGTIYLVSLPRDIYLDSLGAKINSAYSQGMAKKTDAGFLLAKAAVSQITGLTIDYNVQIDFDAFVKIIDTLGGIDVLIDQPFDDPAYPIEGRETDPCNLSPTQLANLPIVSPDDLPDLFPCRFERLHFSQGVNHLDGQTALKFARSRHAEGGEGTDFARNLRQLKLAIAAKNKALSLPNLLNVNKLNAIFTTLKTHAATDIDPGELNAFFKLLIKLKDSNVKTVSLSRDLFYNPPIDERGWILLPKGDNFTLIQNYLKEELR